MVFFEDAGAVAKISLNLKSKQIKSSSSKHMISCKIHKISFSKIVSNKANNLLRKIYFKRKKIQNDKILEYFSKAVIQGIDIILICLKLRGLLIFHCLKLRTTGCKLFFSPLDF